MDLTGWLNFPNFTNARKMNFSFNQIIGLGWSGDPIEILDASNNQLVHGIGAGGRSLKFIDFSNNLYNEILLNMINLVHLNVSKNSLNKLNFNYTTDLQVLDCSNNWNLVLDNLHLPSHFNPLVLDCRNTSLGQIRFFNSSVFDCQTGTIIGQGTVNTLSSSDKIVLGVGLGVGLPGIICLTIGLWMYAKHYLIKNKEKETSPPSQTNQDDSNNAPAKTEVKWYKEKKTWFTIIGFVISLVNGAVISLILKYT